jgi:DNA helicase-2/ATP-dependent DNA helicase PcrA
LPNEVIITAAGWGKTTRLAERARAHEAGKVALVTYTTNNVQEIRNKLFALDRALPVHAEVWSWYRFLLHEMARPYQRALLYRRIDGLFWVEGRSVPYVPRSKTTPFFMTAGGQMYSDKIARFVLECNGATGGEVIARLEERFTSIFVDEIQDMAGYDLDLLELLLRSRINVVMVGDHRQATYSTNNAAKNSAYAGPKIIAKLREWEKASLLTLRYGQETLRCHQLVADLADTFYRDEPKTVSKNDTVTGHDGVFVVKSNAVPEYVARFRPQVLRLDRRTQCDGHFAMNFGEVKGMTFDRVLIFPHKKGRQWLASGDYAHVVDSAAKMYVGITRARQSVAFVFDGPCDVPTLVRYQPG